MKHSQTDRWAQFEQLPRPLTGHVSTPPNLVFPRRHQHAWAQLSYVTEGHLQVWTPGGRFIALPNKGVWIPPRVQHRVTRPPNATVRSLYLDTDVFNMPWLACGVLSINPLLHELIQAFCATPTAYSEGSKEERLVLVLIDQLRACQQIDLVLPWPSDPQLDRLCRQLQGSPAADINLETVARRFGISSKTLTRRFQKETGLGFRLWRQRARLIHALPLLERGDRITDVALACGYESLSTFIAVFKSYTGVTPRQFVLGNQNNPGIAD